MDHKCPASMLGILASKVWLSRALYNALDQLVMICRNGFSCNTLCLQQPIHIAAIDSKSWCMINHMYHAKQPFFDAYISILKQGT